MPYKNPMQTRMAATRAMHQQQTKGRGKIRNPDDGHDAGKGCFDCGKTGPRAIECTAPNKETRSCNRCGKTWHLASDCRVPARELKESLKDEGAVVWGSLMVEEDIEELNAQMAEPSTQHRVVDEDREKAYKTHSTSIVDVLVDLKVKAEPDLSD